ncbi:MAG: hypothetical protein ACUVRZ_11260 [Desulfobacca sp.]|uniref:hypothetical protein n=1 Tax=Desulfobacca sp. TaxID=2067990 RepID=UPI00404A0435
MTAAVTFVCCVEAGPLELMTGRLLASLRRWGGRLASAPVLAVTPRRGPHLLPETLALFQEYGVRYVRYAAQEEFAWNNFMNKPHALVLAEREAETPCLAWLDSDILILSEPDQLALRPDEAFAACAPDKNVGTAGPGDANDPYWRQVGQTLQVDVEQLPWLMTAADQQQIRFYFNSGVFVFRRGLQFAAEFLQDCRKILQAKISSKQAGIFFTDQVALGLTAFRLGLPYRLLDHDHNYAVGSKSQEALVPDKIRNVKILHHHDAMWPPLWPRLLSVLQETHPEVYQWLQPLGPLTNPRRGVGKVYLKVLQAFRTWQQQQFVKTCHSY